MTRGRLVIVDDEPVILRLLTSMFADEPIEVVACSNGAAGLQAIDAGLDVLLTDKNLPDIGGLELLQRAKAADPLCEVLVITGYASLDTVLTALQMNAFDYIVKPPSDIFHVKRKVFQALEKVRLARENVALLERLTARNDELEKTLAELREVQSELIQSEKLAGIGTLAAGIAHEISSPLFGIMGLAEAIVDEEDAEAGRRYAAEIVDYSRSIKEIVGQLSGYSRSSVADFEGEVGLPGVIADAVVLVKRSHPITGDRVAVRCPDGLLLRGKSNELQQVFVNLLKNAVDAVHDRHGPGAGSVTVSAEAEDRWVRVDVSDDGGGIPADRLGSIFDPFYTTKPPGQGTGLGLNIVYRILTRFGATITVESTVGEGTTFRMRFPIP
ncbi:MAG: response regulator [Alphaproteobacteria bacterium]|nr:response regulator [Alphaproteobacteria bacterium]MCB9690414.1 response regulator [Alphaproteobacteria bacterium]